MKNKDLKITMPELRKLLIERVTKIVEAEEAKPPHLVRFANLEFRAAPEDDEFLSLDIDGTKELCKVIEKRIVKGVKIGESCFDCQIHHLDWFVISVESLFDEINGL